MAPHAIPLWRNRAFSIFWLAQALSYTGSQVTEFAIPLTAALVLGAGALQMGVLGAAEMLPPLLFGLVAGVLVDRVRRALLLLWCSLAQGLLLSTVPLAAWLGVLTLSQLYAVAFVTGSWRSSTAWPRRATSPSSSTGVSWSRPTAPCS